MRLTHLAAAAILLLPAACTSWNPLVAMGIQSEPAHKPTPLTPITAKVNPTAAWSVNVGKAGAFRFRPDIEGGRVYTAAADGNVTVVDEENGRIFLRTETKKRLSGGVEVGESKILLGTDKGEVVALDVTGKTAWTTNVAGEVIAPPAVAGKVVVARTSDGRIFGLNVADGKRLWVFQRPTPALLLRSEAGVIAQGSDVVAGYPNGKLIALDADDGKLTWEVTVSAPRGATELERIADVAGLPVVEGNAICAAAFQGKVACFDIKSRNTVWSRDVSSSRALARDVKHVYVVDDTGAVHALDKGTGTSVWKQDKLQYRRVTEPVVHAGRVVVGDGFGFVHVLSADDGELVGRLATDGSEIRSIVKAPNGVLVQTVNGALTLVRF
jgi:outer membrane protein assembly factor BamB